MVSKKLPVNLSVNGTSHLRLEVNNGFVQFISFVREKYF